MNARLSVSMFVLILICVILDAAREICFKGAADQTGVAQTLLKPLTWLGVVLWAIELFAWIRVLQEVPLGVAFPLMALTYVLMVWGSAQILKEKVGKRRLLGALLVTIGVAVVGATNL